MISVEELWKSSDAKAWNDALERYWCFVKPANLELERSLVKLTVDRVRNFSATEWYDFLLDEYFRWKYTAANRYASTTRHLKKFEKGEGLQELDRVRHELLDFDVEDIHAGLDTACKIPGLGVAGASGLLALMYPDKFATVDQFVVKALREVRGLKEDEATRLAQMNPENLSPKDGELLIFILRREAARLKKSLKDDRWNPRLLEMVLWTYGR